MLILFVMTAPLLGQGQRFVPVTDQMLLNPSPDDWLMFSRTYDAQRFSPLNQVNRQNVSQLALAWSRGLGPGITETIPTVYNGVMYVNAPGGAVQALDASQRRSYLGVSPSRTKHSQPGRRRRSSRKRQSICTSAIENTGDL